MNTQDDRKVLLITGAARRIGAAIASLFHQHGYDIVLHYNRSGVQAAQLVTDFNKLRPYSACCIKANLCTVSEVQRLANETLEWRGAVDVLINNASGFYPSAIGAIDESVWEDLLGSNLKGAFFLSQALAPALQTRNGCIINITDRHADGALKGYPVYSIAKAGLQMMTKALARELAPTVRVNSIAPGAILWPEQALSEGSVEQAQQAAMDGIALRRMGTADDVAATAWYLAEDAPYTTGQTIRVDGGRMQGNSLLS